MKVAVVTGGSSGIGLELIKLLISSGEWKVYSLSRREPSFLSDNHKWIHCDFYSESFTDCLDAVSEASIDLLVCNAGVAFEEPSSLVSSESYRKMFDVNVLAPMLVVNSLREKIQRSTILSISSVADRLIDKDFALYSSSKAAITRYFEGIADELKDAKVYSLLPDYVDTPMLHDLQDGRNFDWGSTIKVEDLTKFAYELVREKFDVPSGSNIIVVNEALKEDLENVEKLYGYNTDTEVLNQLT